MPAFEFRLETVLQYQEKHRKLAEVRRQQALQALLLIEAEIDRLQQKLREIAASMAGSLGREDVRVPWESLQSQSQWLANLLSAQEQRLQPARAEFAKAHDAHKKVATLVEALLDLKQRRWQTYRDEVALQEQQRVEEFVLRRWTEATHGRQDD
jgi:flagellar biosynthesis chaperone FliJ